MAFFVMPKLGADMTYGKIIAWRKNVGDTVARGEIIAEIETDKVDIEAESFTSGVIEKILVEPGTKFPVGTALAIIREEGKPVETEIPLPLQPTLPEPPITISPPPAEIPRAAGGEAERIPITPAAKKVAASLGIDPATVKGTGPGGRVTREDIERAASERAAGGPEMAGEERAEGAEPRTLEERQERMRQAIAAAMARSKREIPHYYLSTSIDMSRALEWLTEENRKRSVENRLLYGVLLIKAVALALRDFPELNSSWVEGRAVRSRAINVGVAISLRQGGLVAPAIHSTDEKGLDELMKDLQDLVKRARAGSLKGSELFDPTVTITNLGEQGVETVYGIIYPPQVALIGFGRIVERPWSVDGRIVARPILNATLSADHRASDGHRGGLFLKAVSDLLQEPEKL